MNRIDRVLEATRAQRRAALIVFITAGDPDLETTIELIPELQHAGADLIELGVPHSDPIAEGPTIQASSLRALRQGIRLPQILDAVRRVRQVSEVPLILMGYLNNVLAFGEAQLVQACAQVGVDGLIVADAPYEEASTLQQACLTEGVHRILLVAPTSTPERVVQIAGRSRGFVYCVAVTGVTGARNQLPLDLQTLVNRIARVTSTPVAVGFGISSPDQAREVAHLADAVIVGSALIQRIGAAAEARGAIDEARRFVEELSQALRSTSQS